MSTMIERVATAVEKHIREYAATTYGTVATHARGTLSVDSEIDASELARAAISAMREPTDAMADAVWAETGDPCWRDNAIEAWRAGIDAALAEKPAKQEDSDV